MRKRWKQWQTLFWGCSKITADGDCSHEIKRHLLLGRKIMTKLDSILKSRDITLPTKVHLVSSVQSLSHVWLFATQWIVARQVSLSITNSWRSIELVMASNHLILCHTLLLLPSVFLSIRVFSSESALCIRWAKVLEFQLQHQSFQWTLRTDLL